MVECVCGLVFGNARKTTLFLLLLRGYLERRGGSSPSPKGFCWGKRNTGTHAADMDQKTDRDIARAYRRHIVLQPPASSHLASANAFFNHGIQSVLKWIPPIHDGRQCITPVQFVVSRPSLANEFNENTLCTVEEARAQQLPYTCMVTLNMRLHTPDQKDSPVRESSMVIARLLMCVGARGCPNEVDPTQQKDASLDRGGWFLLRRGQVRRVQPRLIRRLNCTFVLPVPPRGALNADSEARSLVATVCSRYGPYHSKHDLWVDAAGRIVFSVFETRRPPLPVLLLMMALGSQSPEEDLSRGLQGVFPKGQIRNWLQSSLHGDALPTTADAALDRLVKHYQLVLTASATDEKSEQQQKRKKKKMSKRQQQRAQRDPLDRARFILDHVLLPHCRTKQQKIHYLAYMWQRLMLVKEGRRPPDALNDLANLVVLHVGDYYEALFTTLFRRHWGRARWLIQEAKQDEAPSVDHAFNRIQFSDEIHAAFSSGEWPSGTNYWSKGDAGGQLEPRFAPGRSFRRKDRAGGSGSSGNDSSSSGGNSSTVTALLEWNNHCDLLRSMARVQHDNFFGPGSADVHGSYVGFFDPSVSPEKEKTGRERELANLAWVAAAPENEQEVLVRDSVLLNRCAEKGNTRIFWNGQLVRWTNEDPLALAQWIVARRATGIFPRELVVDFTDHQLGMLHLWLTPGTVKRMVLLGRGETAQTDHLDAREIASRQLTMLAVAPLSALRYALRPSDKVTHSEVMPASTLGPTTGSITFTSHQDGAREQLDAHMTKSSLGTGRLSKLPRVTLACRHMSTAPTQMLHYHQLPLSGTVEAGALGYGVLGNTFLARVVIGHVGGFGIEDAIVVNQRSVDLGLAASMHLLPYSIKIARYERQDRRGERTITGVTDRLTNPLSEQDCVRPHERDYSALPTQPTCPCGWAIGATQTPHPRTPWCPRKGILPSSHGATTAIVPVNTAVQPNQVLVGMVTTTPGGDSTMVHRDASLLYDGRFPGWVVDVRVAETPDDVVVTVLVAETVPVDKGTKIRCHGQKNCNDRCMPNDRLPFALNGGWTPDIIMSSEMIARQTLGYELHMMDGLAEAASPTCCHGEGDETHTQCRFQHNNFVSGTDEDIYTRLSRRLQLAGFTASGQERFVHPVTGEVTEMAVFWGFLPYSKQPQNASLKMTARAVHGGPTVLGTGQANRGRNGGLRAGEMERHVNLCMGAARLNRETLSERSEATRRFWTCTRCGRAAEAKYVYDRVDSVRCRGCGPEAPLIALTSTTSLHHEQQLLEQAGITLRLKSQELDPDCPEQALQRDTIQLLELERRSGDPFAIVRGRAPDSHSSTATLRV
jgi:DNA-directed RNA polymerase beta subunit